MEIILNILLVFLVTPFFLLNMISCEDDEVKKTLIQFMTQLSGQQNNNSTLVWKLESDPCKDRWYGVYCDAQMSIKRLNLYRLNLSGTLDVALLCNLQPLAASLTFLSLDDNNISGRITSEIGNCKQLTRLHVRGNQLTGNLPTSLAMLNNLKRLDISDNRFSGLLPNVARISGLNMFLAQNNDLSGTIPAFDFSNFDHFNVSFNNFSGQIPDVNGHFVADSFLGNQGLCGYPLQKNCSEKPLSSTVSQTSEEKSKGPSKEQILMYSGYAALGVIVILFVILKLCTIKKTGKKVEAALNGDIEKSSYVSSESKAEELNKSGFSVASESGTVSQQSLIVLSKPVVNELKLEELLRAPAELIGRGNNGSLYKVMLTNGIIVVVKRIKGWSISSVDFKQRMQLLNQAKHPHVLSPLAFYCSKQEKLLVYEYQKNGSLFKLLHGKFLNTKFSFCFHLYYTLFVLTRNSSLFYYI